MQEWTFQAIATVANAALAIILVSWRSGPKRPRTFWIAVSCCVVLVGAQVSALYQRYIHDSEVAARLDLKSSGDIVFAEDAKFDNLKKERSEAASAILKFLRDGNWNSMTDREEDSLGEVLSFG